MKNETVQSADPPRGLICPKCGCRHFHVVKVSHVLGYIRRRKGCRHCGHRVTTTERIVGGHRSNT